MTRVSNHLSVITLNLNELNSPSQRLDIGLTKFLKTWSNYIHCLQKAPFRGTDTIDQKWKNETYFILKTFQTFLKWNEFHSWNETFHANSKKKEAWDGSNISKKIYFNTPKFKR